MIRNDTIIGRCVAKIDDRYILLNLTMSNADAILPKSVSTVWFGGQIFKITGNDYRYEQKLSKYLLNDS